MLNVDHYVINMPVARRSRAEHDAHNAAVAAIWLAGYLPSWARIRRGSMVP